ncbi:hypothetical protein GCM10010116_53900 [Microbispora rosea subsp. aerata]|nr:DUF2332 family protein [Microbispora rosea]GGO26841.1 hypothetical protein GCM10010116_53900 [Microbispora rosea subsp. aerata]GIH58427.1 hypothetical protein Mro02_53410 [Microbispora rosea subsp. aerata]GLJ87115.1 hypothetical protein GCM10017588_58590 [Microbispora rosea subsp. aerata]
MRASRPRHARLTVPSSAPQVGLAKAPEGATLVVFHTSVLYQVPPPRREAFAEVVRGLPGHWVANETPDVLPHPGLPEPPGTALHGVLSLDGRPLAWTLPHGQAMTWFG